MLLSVAVLAGCAARTAQQPGSDRSQWYGDPRLYEMLNAYPIEQSQRDSVAEYATEHLGQTDERLAEAAEDLHAPVPVRLNALLLLSERGTATQLPVFRAALDADDPRIRAMAASSMRRFMDSHPHDAEQLARMALEDAAPEVQAQALHVLGDRDAALLRAYLPRAADPELRTIATDLVQVAESRGVALTGDEATGMLRRETPHGFTVAFNPRQHWPQWDAAVGDVVISRGTATAATLTDIEAVAGVVPVFFSPEGTYMVYERARTIVVRSLNDGTERVIGPGIAPRVLPFTDDFVFAREEEDGRTEARHQTNIRYEVMRASFGGTAAPHGIGEMSVVTTFDRHGNYSPLRWMRVEDRSGNFYLTAAGTSAIFSLPDPFGG
ncbi:hypothetical protein BH23GEM9_BH23GEM9_25240 [soil metagenome]